MFFCTIDFFWYFVFFKKIYMEDAMDIQAIIETILNNDNYKNLINLAHDIVQKVFSLEISNFKFREDKNTINEIEEIKFFKKKLIGFELISEKESKQISDLDFYTKIIHPLDLKFIQLFL